MDLPDIRDLSLQEFQEYLTRSGQKPFRGRQVFEWIYEKCAEDFDGMTNLPAELRGQLKKDFHLAPLSLETGQAAADGTKKFLFRLSDGERVESVLIPARGRNTLCVSTQAGCKFACRFCASGIGGFKRNLTVAEILGQIVFAKKACAEQARSSDGRALSHVVFMGTGEPLDNYENVLKSVRMINATEGAGIAARHITISTCGLIPQIERLAKEGLQIELSISLHGFDDASRTQLVPVNKKYPFEELLRACRAYARATKRQVTFEYILIDGVTVTPEASRKLARALKGMLAKVNLIPYNPVAEFKYRVPDRRSIGAFRDDLVRAGIPATIRTARGEDISAACGQLRHSKIQK